MPTLPATEAVPVQDDLVLPIPSRDGTLREYRIPPCTVETMFDLMALDAVWTAIMVSRKSPEGALTAADIATRTVHPGVLQQRIQRLADGKLSTEDILALPLGPASEQMLADGIGKRHYVLASMTAMYWHLAGDDAARQVWAAGKVPALPSITGAV